MNEGMQNVIVLLIIGNCLFLCWAAWRWETFIAAQIAAARAEKKA